MALSSPTEPKSSDANWWNERQGKEPYIKREVFIMSYKLQTRPSDPRRGLSK